MNKKIKKNEQKLLQKFVKKVQRNFQIIIQIIQIKIQGNFHWKKTSAPLLWDIKRYFFFFHTLTLLLKFAPSHDQTVTIKPVTQTSYTNQLHKPVTQTSYTNQLYKPVIQSSYTNQLHKPVIQTSHTNQLHKPVSQTSFTNQSHKPLHTIQQTEKKVTTFKGCISSATNRLLTHLSNVFQIHQTCYRSTNGKEQRRHLLLQRIDFTNISYMILYRVSTRLYIY